MEHNLAACISIIKDVFTIVALGVGAYAGLTGLSTWKRQIKGQSDHELSRRTLKGIYRVRSEIDKFRNPSFTGKEEIALLERLKKNNVGAEFLNLKEHPEGREIYAIKWNRVVEAHEQLKPELSEVEAVWGKEYRDKIGLLELSLDRLLQVMLLFLNPKLEGNLPENMMRVLNGSSWLDDPEDFSKQLEDNIKAIEKLLAPKLKL